MILLFAAVNRKRCEQERPFVSTGIFLLGYLVVWSVFSAVATIVQWHLHERALLTSMMVSASPLLSGATLTAAGLFQLTPLKHTCLKHCRSPLGFLVTDWRDGAWGAFLMGLQHGSYCLGCCWLLMTLLFVAGVMNLVWLAVITIFVLLEKVAPAGMHLSRNRAYADRMGPMDGRRSPAVTRGLCSLQRHTDVPRSASDSRWALSRSTKHNCYNAHS